MLNPKESEKFYIQSSSHNYAKDLGFIADSILDKQADELDGIEVLVQMAKQGKIDPWNIDIADIADKYMIHISESKSNNLRLSGRALFFLAVLLKLKSNILVGIDPMQFEEQQSVDTEYDENDAPEYSEDLYYQS